MNYWTKAQFKDVKLKNYFLRRLERQLGNYRWKKYYVELKSTMRWHWDTAYSKLFVSTTFGSNDECNLLLEWEAEMCLISHAWKFFSLVLPITVKIFWDLSSTCKPTSYQWMTLGPFPMPNNFSDSMKSGTTEKTAIWRLFQHHQNMQVTNYSQKHKKGENE